MVRPACGLCLRTGTTCQFPSRRRRPARPLKRRKTHSTLSDGSLAWLLNLVGVEDITQLSTESVQAITGRQGSSEVPHRGPGDGMFAAEPMQDETTVETSADTRQEPFLPAQSVASPVSYDLAMHLIETFFTHIQPWLPAFHKPRFTARCSWELQKGPDAMKGLSPEMRLILYSMFALSARFSRTHLLASVRPLDRDKQFVTAARQAYFELRALLEPNLAYLQGCILLAFHAYTAELDSRAWILTGVCVRLAYDLGLAEIDDDSFDEGPGCDPVTKEEMRRAWWLVWELDTFGSMVSRRPFAVDRHHFTVHLPIADADWFSENIVQSSPLTTPLSEAWRSLQDSENQDPRAWFLVTNHLLSLLFKRLQRTRKGSKDCLTEFEIAFNCLKLSLPASFHILSYPPSFEPKNFAAGNWIMGTHLMLMTAYSVFASLSTGTTEGLALLSGANGNSDKPTRIRDVAFSQLVARWPVEYMTAAHPFFVCMLMPTHIETSESSLSAQVGCSLEGVEQMAELIMTRLSEKWKLAGEIRGKNPGPRRTIIEISDLRQPFTKKLAELDVTMAPKVPF